MPAMLSALSAIESTAPSMVRGTESSMDSRLVVIVDGIGDGESSSFRQVGIELLNARVQAADNALQFGKLLYQFRGQIGFARHAAL